MNVRESGGRDTSKVEEEIAEIIRELNVVVEEDNKKPAGATQGTYIIHTLQILNNLCIM